MDNECLKTKIRENSEKVEKILSDFFVNRKVVNSARLDIIFDAEKYSLLGGGKRIRPFLVNEICRMLGGSERASLPLAAAVEMIHTYSLIHDDLPCMDDDDMRRGKPCNHKVFGESAAVLAGDALLTNAFAMVLNADVSDSTKTEAIRLIAEAAGDRGMIAGQVIDTQSEGMGLTYNELLELHSLKTGCMIELSAALGCLAAGFGAETREFGIACSYARKIGLVFQAIDDLLDVIGDEKTLGKTVGSDAENTKTTFLSFMTPDEVKKYAEKLTNEAVAEISEISGSETVASLAIMLLSRSN